MLVNVTNCLLNGRKIKHQSIITVLYYLDHCIVFLLLQSDPCFLLSGIQPHHAFDVIIQEFNYILSLA